MTADAPGSPVSFPVHVARLPAAGMAVTIEANAEARAALAVDHGLLAVHDFRAELLVAPWKRDGVRVTGTLTARVSQQCVVTLEPLDNAVEATIDVVLVPEGSRLALHADPGSGEIFLDAEGDDAPDSFAGDSVDVGALAEEHFELTLDPWPRKPGALLDSAPEPEAAPSAFAQLAEWKRKR